MIRTILIIFLLICFTSASFAQSGAPKSKEPIEVTADDTLEWHRDKKVYVARKNAIAKQGTSELHGQILTAHYLDGNDPENKDGGMTITKIDAVGNVKVKSEDSYAVGDQGFYNVKTGYSELTGKDLMMRTPSDTITARDKITYHSGKREMNAWGNAKAVRTDDTIVGDRLIGRFKADPKTGETKMHELEAIGHVVITTPTDILYGDNGIYFADTNMATMTGNVRIERGPNIIEGARGEIDLNTNISRIFGGETDTNTESGDSRVRGVFYPE